MDTTTIAVLAGGLVAGLAVAWFLFTWARTRRLRKRFGPEYERIVGETGDQKDAEKELERRARRVENLEIRPLTEEDSVRLGGAWDETQERFVDDPHGAILEADGLVTEAMRLRGYPVANFEQRAADISVEHPYVVSHYREARTIAGAAERGEASTEDIRRALKHYRALFVELLGPAPATDGRRPVEAIR